ncbi:MAG: hypothetical protein JXA42_25285 [Anaerolineales bacterium]|nr:hypothetical protein [Anaerolineales bacterium]
MSEQPQKSDNWKPKVLFIGGTIGLILGLVAGFLFIKLAEEGNGPKKIPTGNLIKLAIASIGVVRQAAQLAD